MPPASAPINPYASPAAPAASHYEELADDAPHAALVAIVARWERLRLLYDGLLIAYVLILSAAVAPQRLLLPQYWGFLAAAGALANLLYFLAPGVDLYLTRYRLSHPITTTLIFLAGTAFTGLLATGAVLGY